MKNLIIILFFIPFICFSQKGKYFGLTDGSNGVIKDGSNGIVYFYLDPLLWLTTKDTSLSDYTYRDGGQGWNNYVDTVLDYSSHGHIAEQIIASKQPVLCNPSDSVGWSFIETFFDAGNGNDIKLNDAKGMTISIWVRLTDLGSLNMFLNKGNQNFATSDRYNYFLGYSSDGSLWFRASDGSAHIMSVVSDVSVITDNDWHYIVGTWDGTTNTNSSKLYLDEIMIKETTPTGTLSSITTDDNLYIGGSDGLHMMKGLIDDVIIDDKGWSSTKIVFHFNQTKKRHE